MTAPRITDPTPGRYNPDDPALRYTAPVTAIPVRHAALSAAVSGIRIRRGQVSVEQVLLVAAVILFPLGLILIVLGWWGAAHTGKFYEQMDYLISGGLLGLGLSVAGGFMYFGYWLSRHLSESARQSGLTLQSLQRIEDLLDHSPGSSVGAVAGGPVLFATPRGTLLHRAECQIVAHRTDLRSVPAGIEGFGYCAMCGAAEAVR